MNEQSTQSRATDEPPMSLRGGAAVDDCHAAPDFDAAVDRPTSEYLEEYYWGVPHLDAVSWRYYLPIFIEHALRNVAAAGSNAVDTFLASLRPPDREAPRFASLSAEQEGAVVAMFLEVLPDEHFEDARDGLVLGDGFWSPHLRAVPYIEEHRHSHMGLVFLRHKRLLKRRDPVYVNDVAGIA